MTACEMCGAESNLTLAQVEGVELNVCKNCASFGKVIIKPKKVFKKKQRNIPKGPEILQVIKENYAQIIREKREKLGLKQKEFAKYLAERESLIHKIEAGNYTPSLDLARKMEKQLKISLVEQKKVEPQKLKTNKQSFTIGDIIKIK